MREGGERGREGKRERGEKVGRERGRREKEERKGERRRNLSGHEFKIPPPNLV